MITEVEYKWTQRSDLGDRFAKGWRWKNDAVPSNEEIAEKIKEGISSLEGTVLYETLEVLEHNRDDETVIHMSIYLVPE